MNFIIRVVPKNILSFFLGKIAWIPLPWPISTITIKLFAKFCKIDSTEAKNELKYYKSVGEFFSRQLKEGTRPIETADVVSPVDGTIIQLGEIAGDKLIQVKGSMYSLSDLLVNKKFSVSYIGGFFVTIYLSPRDYHRIHSPVDGMITDLLYIPGTLWPVNAWGLKNIKGIYCKNERIITVIQSSSGKVAVVKVGAFNVGSIKINYDNVVSNSFSSLMKQKNTAEHKVFDPAIVINKGEEIGSFNLGSTVILLFEKGNFVAGEKCKLDKIKVGEALGMFS